MPHRAYSRGVNALATQNACCRVGTRACCGTFTFRRANSGQREASGLARLVNHQVGRDRLLGGEDVRALRSGCTAMSSGADAD